MVIGFNRAIKELKKQRKEVNYKMMMAVIEVEKPFREELDEIYRSIAALERERKLSKQMK
jgi:hypothetical protein